jgi:hypothetical protein
MKTIYYLIGLCSILYSCDKDKNKEYDQRTISTMLMTPDSLQSPEDKILLQKMEAVFYDHCIIKNDRFELTIRKEEFIVRGIPGVCYDMLKKDIDNMNNYLDTTSIPKHLVLDSFKESQEKYREKGKNQPSE